MKNEKQNQISIVVCYSVSIAIMTTDNARRGSSIGIHRSCRLENPAKDIMFDYDCPSSDPKPDSQPPYFSAFNFIGLLSIVNPSISSAAGHGIPPL